MTRACERPPVRVTLELPRSSARSFGALLQQGVPVRTSAPSAWSFLTEDLGVDPAYAKERITTVFLDGQVVDDLARAPLRDRSLLALSAAMPGIVGATLRRGGYYAAMRAAITRTAEREPQHEQGGHVVRVKLFNLLIAELGPVLLAHGILVGAAERAAIAAAGLDVCEGSELQIRFHGEDANERTAD